MFAVRGWRRTGDQVASQWPGPNRNRPTATRIPECHRVLECRARCILLRRGRSLKRSSATASTSRVLALLDGVCIVRGRKAEEIEALTEERCVEVGAINAASDVVEWVYALRLEVKVWETRSGSGAGVSRPTTVTCLCGGVRQREIVLSVEPKWIRDWTHLETNHNHNEALDRYTVSPVPSRPPGLPHPSVVIPRIRGNVFQICLVPLVQHLHTPFALSI